MPNTAPKALNNMHKLPCATENDKRAPPAPTSGDAFTTDDNDDDDNDDDDDDDDTVGRVADAACACTTSLARCAQ